ncbi:MAG: HD domain-containing protein [Acidobacteriota bacterium]|nr:MAG: HD domain-containing protein [Acidobacteriota bacterium]
MRDPPAREVTLFEQWGRLGDRGFRPRLFFVLLAVVLVVSLVPLGLFSHVALSGMREALATSQQERQLEIAASLSQRFDSFLRQKGREAVKLGEVLGALGRGREGSLLTEFLDGTVVLARYRPARGPASLALAPELVLSDELGDALETDALLLLEQGAAPGPPSARDAVLSGPYTLGPERILAVTVSAPVQRRGELLGVFQEIALIQNVWEEVAAAVTLPTRLFLFDPSGQVVASSADPTDRFAQGSGRLSIVQQFLRSPGGSRGARAYDVSDSSGVSRSMLGSFSTTDDGWGVMTEVEEKLALAPVQRLLDDVAFGGALAAGLAIVAALVLGGMISRPITRLAAISRRVARGDFSVSATSSRVRELDQLASGFNTMARQLGELVERFRAGAREANDMFLGVIRALAEAIDEKDPYTKGHSVRVNRYAVIIGRYLGRSREEIRALHVSSLLHDVGKIGIDDAILKKPSTLTPEEFAVMKTHTDRGAKIMGRIPQMKSIIPGLRFHHERWGGGGYPVGLKGEEIPIQARIIAVADAFDAMTTTRPYQAPFTPEAAVARINDLKGVAFAPEIVEAFNRAYEAGEMVEVYETRPEPDSLPHPAQALTAASSEARGDSRGG